MTQKKKLLNKRVGEELVDKATPKKIAKRKVDIAGEIAEIFGLERYATIEYCPNCGETLRQYGNYCKNCGQALDWSEDDENS